jgi:capsular polysaccharide transport system ATP-binding protein
MLELKSISKSYALRGNTLSVLKGIDLCIQPGQKMAILGRNGSGKSTLIRIIGGIESPDAGMVNRSMSISWPLGYSGGMQGSLTGLDNIHFLCRIYQANRIEVRKYVEDFAELGKFLHEPVKTYSSGMRGRLAFALSMAFDFDCFLIDEGLSAGDARFTERCRTALEERKNRAILMVSHSQHSIRQFCNEAGVLQDGKLHCFNNMNDAYAFYEGRIQ